MSFTLDEAFEKLEMPLFPQTILKSCYEQDFRSYHNLDHISEMLKHVPKDHNEVEIVLDAILFHDIVYSPTPTAPGLNEALRMVMGILVSLLSYFLPSYWPYHQL